MTALHIVHLDRATIGPDVALTKPACPHHWVSHDRTTPDEVVPRLKDADVAIVNKIALSAEDIAQLPKLKMIAIAATGFDKIDIEACRARGIVVSNIRGYARQTVPEHTFALMLALRRGLKGYSEDVARGEWQRSERFCLFTHPVADLNGSTLGLIGTGSIGGAVGRIAEAFGMTVLKSGRKGDASPADGHHPFEEVIARADVLSLHCPLTPDTRHLIAAPEFARMKRNAIVINTSRGGLVHEGDLITALDEGQIAGAGFDVVTTEPPAEDHIFMKNLDRPNFILTPHTAWASNEAMQILWDQLVDHIDAYANGNPTNNLIG